MEKQDLELDLQLCHKFYAASNSITRLYRPILKELDLTYPQYIVMITLWEQDRKDKNSNLSAKSLSSIAKIDSGALSLMLNKLETKDYISIKSDELDKRAKNISVTSKGRRLYKKAQSIPNEMGQFFSHMKVEDFEKLNKLMKKLLSGLE